MRGQVCAGLTQVDVEAEQVTEQHRRQQTQSNGDSSQSRNHCSCWPERSHRQEDKPHTCVVPHCRTHPHTQVSLLKGTLGGFRQILAQSDISRLYLRCVNQQNCLMLWYRYTHTCTGVTESEVRSYSGSVCQCGVWTGPEKTQWRRRKQQQGPDRPPTAPRSHCGGRTCRVHIVLLNTHSTALISSYHHSLHVESEKTQRHCQESNHLIWSV